MNTDLTFITNEKDNNLSERFKVLIEDTKEMKKQKMKCMHDYKNAIQVGNIDYQCRLCGGLLDPK